MNVLLYKKIQLILPDEYEEITAEEKDAYISSGKVDYLYAQKASRLLFTATKTGNALKDEDVPRSITTYLQLFTRMVPGFVKGQMLQKNICGKTVAILTYKSNAPDRDLFNIAVLLSLDGAEYQFHFVCTLSDAPEHMYSFLSVLESMTLCEEYEP